MDGCNPIYILLPVAYSYSYLISFLFLKYFRNKSKTNIIIFYISIFHLSFLFFLPGVFIFINWDKNNEYKKIFLKIIDIFSYINHSLNKFLYPIIIIYCSSGYITNIYRLFCISIKDLILQLYAFWGGILLLILFIFKGNFLMNIYNDKGKILLSFLNLIDLILIYFEIGYSFQVSANGDDVCNQNYGENEYNRQRHQYLVLGKLIYYEKQKIKSFLKYYKELSQIYLDYLENNTKYNKIKAFIDSITSRKYFNKDEIKIVKNDNIKEIKDKRKLEQKISKPYKKCKKYYRKFERIKNIREEESFRILSHNKRKCCRGFCDMMILYILKLILIMSLGIIIYADFKLYKLSIKNYNNIEHSNNTIPFKNDTDNFIEDDCINEKVIYKFIRIIFFYPLFLLVLIPISGMYIIPLIYSLINRRLVTGDFFYSKNCADTIILINSIKKITGIIIPIIFLGFQACTELSIFGSEQVEFLNGFFKIPYSKYLLRYRFILLAIFLIITTCFETINIKCCCKKIKININDFMFRRNQYIEEGKKEKERILSLECTKIENLEISYNINNSNENIDANNISFDPKEISLIKIEENFEQN